MKKIIVISLGGSLIIPDSINLGFLKSFKKIILKNKDKYKFVIVCGGGKTARNYIHGLDNEKLNEKIFLQCLLGISATRLNAKFMTYFFNKLSNQKIPKNMKEVNDLLVKDDIVFCGALRYSDNETSDSTSARLANYLDSDFINITDVNGLYNKNPKESKNAKLIPKISFIDFYKITEKLGFNPGQHFVLDKKGAIIIKKHKIKTYIIGPNIKNLDNLLNNKDFIGTVIQK